MSTTLSPVTPGERSLRLPALALAAGGLGLAVVGAVDHGGPSYVVAAIVTAAWALGAFLVARRLPQRPLALLMGLLALVLGAALYAWAKVDAGEDGFELAALDPDRPAAGRGPAPGLRRARRRPAKPRRPDHGGARLPRRPGPRRGRRPGVGRPPGPAVLPGRPRRRGGGPGRVPEPLPEGVGRRSGSAAVDRVGRGPGLRRRRPGRPARRSPRLAQPSRHGRRGRHGGRAGRLRGLHGAPAVDRDRPGAGPHGGGGGPARPRRGRLPVRGRRPGPGARGRGAVGAGPVHARGRGSVPSSPSRPVTASRKWPTSGSTASATGRTTRCAPSPGACPGPSPWTSSCCSWPSP